MGLAGKLTRLYFDYIYNSVYDSTVARLHAYNKLHEACINKLKLQDGDQILCVGLGTGNEISHIYKMNSKVSIMGVDYSSRALRMAYNKALSFGQEIKLYVMDGQYLQFTAESFDKVLCIHVMDFIEDRIKVTSEIMRVLRNNGQFVITYPSGKEDLNLGRNILKDNMAYYMGAGKHRLVALFKSIAQMALCIVYLPLYLRPRRKVYSHEELEEMMTEVTNAVFRIKEEPVYHDFIVFGQKRLANGGSDVSRR